MLVKLAPALRNFSPLRCVLLLFFSAIFFGLVAVTVAAVSAAAVVVVVVVVDRKIAKIRCGRIPKFIYMKI